MEQTLVSPAAAAFFGIPGYLLFSLIPLVGIGAFAYIIGKRLSPLLKGEPDPRINEVPERIVKFLKFGMLQWRQPRYLFAGVLHILLFAGFLVLSLGSISLVIIGIRDGFVLPGLGGRAGVVYSVFKDFAATIVLIVAITAAIRRGVFKPKRYDVPSRYGDKDHTGEAVLVLLLIAALVTCDMLFEGSRAAAQSQAGALHHLLVPVTGSWVAAQLFSSLSPTLLQKIHLGSYFLHEVVFFSFLCLLPFGKHFHVITSLPNVFLTKLSKGRIKPVRWGVTDDELDGLESLGVKKLEDFSWKHMLDFYSCVDCGRCSDNCPANAVGRPLSPRFISIKCRDYAFNRYPLFGDGGNQDERLIGTVLHEDEIWSCTTCGACEEECPVLIEYIDKIVDLRRGMVDEGMVPQSLQKPLGALEKRGNPWGKLEKKRADWTKEAEFAANYPVKVFDGQQQADTLYFVDSITSYDDRMQEIGRATARVLTAAGIDFGILGADERDSGNEVLRFGEETLYQTLKAHNMEVIKETGVRQIVTADPHAFNALKNDYQGLPPVEHISQTIMKSLSSGRIRFSAVEDPAKVYTFHDPCYLGRHNELYDDPRGVLDAIPGLRKVEMDRCRDRSFCCGGGGLMLFFEPEEEQRMGVLRVKMAQEAGANVIVTACPFCMVNIEDAIKVSGLEGTMEVIDLVELADRHLSVT
ncbi:electron transfer flavoprotein-associated cytochrome b and CCG domain pair iron-sulfur cluster-binding oxidoreductase [Geobacter metallireducens GS-15]|uniref:Electron transfer flavoprotein-associated cytochrome b and CCG domain pair iron-sulfur cluster-binding oxidoreductase n=1 Tax=Geobacter metallireducens (strain ATCC 53774 / DSM 7210 / GS-15) TaxID=269799 RepID=Q39TD1_GEOMG|nr:(Fe-S)-binding protein [Geobacter metallireducens]ABB32493.1 electron transfer flavoprotein-associated cytochrome b and CCG domain pair iron-sulfur cluster-binding oxidoreductase [Geobacter metallireducens GS-15]